MSCSCFNDGAADTHTRAVDVMGRLQLGKQFTVSENALIVTVLKTRTGEHPGVLVPILLPSIDAKNRAHNRLKVYIKTHLVIPPTRSPYVH